MSEEMKKASCPVGFRTSIGGQALIEGVMMRGPQKTAMAVRNKEGEIIVEDVEDARDKSIPKFLRLPVLRGVANFIQTMILGYKSIMRSAELAGIDEDEGEMSKFDKFLNEKLGEKLFGIIGAIAMVLGLVLAVALFVLVPTAIVKLFNTYVFDLGAFTAVFEGLIKIGVFIGYIALVRLMPDIKRTFEYHGAEHKTIACYEAGEELTVENARKYERFHPRCGTSFILIVLIVSILVFLAVPSSLGIFGRFILRIVLLPFVVGIGYEIIKLVGKHDNKFTRIISAPGLWLQRLTTNEPDDKELEVAIESLKAVMPQDKKRGRMVMKISDVLALLLKNKTAEMKILIEETLGFSKTYMLTHPQFEISQDKQDLLNDRIKQLDSGRPLQYILGKWEFFSREFYVGEGVLIPREDTGAVIDLAKDFLIYKNDAVFADLGSGSGCIAVTLCMETKSRGYAVERSKEAYKYLIKNIEQAKGSLQAVLGDMFSSEVLDKLPPLDLVVSNPPYITESEMKELDDNVLKEPSEALFGGKDGLDYYRKIAKIYKQKLKDGGMLCFEVGFAQADAVLEILKQEGFHSFCEKKDFNGIRRAVGAIK